MAKAKKAVPNGYQTVTPVLTLNEARKALDWYAKALGAEVIASSAAPDGKIMHAEIQIGNSRIMLHDAMMQSKGPKEYGGSPAGLWIFVDDCDALFNRAVAAGATVQMPMADQFWGDRLGAFTDPFGYAWSIASRKEDLTGEEMEQRQEQFFKQMAAKKGR